MVDHLTGMPQRLRILFALPGLHRVTRGAEVAFEELGRALSAMSECEVTLLGSGQERDGEPYRFVHAGCLRRELFERWPTLPCLRSHFEYEELSFLPGLLRKYRPEDYDITITCSYPYTNWALRSRKSGGHRPWHIYVTQNGDWPVHENRREYRYFGCDGLVCTNPVYYERNRERWPTVLIPNGVNPDVFFPGKRGGGRSEFDLPESARVVLMVSALSPTKKVVEGIEAVAKVPGAFLVVAGDGELRAEVEFAGKNLLSDRFRRIVLPRSKMPSLYRCADVFLHMSQNESSANAYIEALATGLPIVTHDWAVTRWTLEDQAIFVDTSDSSATARGLCEALDTLHSKEVESRRAIVERRFTWAAIARQYHEFFLRIASQAVGEKESDLVAADA
ncbi:MAG: glycosyltransferase family 4 protein [Phycisphaerales bacterium]|nr:glycosyltransferase family 4 protein [Phycisphaerales bacterium]